MPGHPRPGHTKKDVDARVKPGHDGVERAVRSKFILSCRFPDQFIGGFRQQLVGRFAID
jgi:hypothetical protein